MNPRLRLLSIALILLFACNVPSLAPEPPTETPLASTDTALPADTATSTAITAPSATPTATGTTVPSETPTATQTATATRTPTRTQTPTETPTPTPDQPLATANVNSNCRLGAGTIYHFSTNLEPGESAVVDGKNGPGTWLWVQPDTITFHCWISTSLVTLNVDLSDIPFVDPPLPTNPNVAQPGSVQAIRNGDNVDISWSAGANAQDYVLELRVCQNGNLVDLAFLTAGLSFSVLDEASCSGQRMGELFAHNNAGYSPPVTIPWP